mmetsp:Transcript_46366/g.113763  ORF Transcript_46366/g.113763 Transcript_46366/m.113763 type:complete len:317 (+) Transcript_46366:472-1422(+)
MKRDPVRVQRVHVFIKKRVDNANQQNIPGHRRPVVQIDESYANEALATQLSRFHDDDDDYFQRPKGKGRRLCFADAIVTNSDGTTHFVRGARWIFEAKSKAAASKNDDYHSAFNHNNWEKWVMNRVLPNIPASSIIQCDNAAYNNVDNRLQTHVSAMKKAECREFLARYGSKDTYEKGYDDAWLVPRLKEEVRKYVEPAWERKAKQLGHVVWRQPPYSSSFLNDIEKVWGVVKNAVARRYTNGRTLQETRKQLEEEFAKVKPADLNAIVKHNDKVRQQWIADNVKLDELEDGASASDDDTDSDSGLSGDEDDDDDQ